MPFDAPSADVHLCIHQPVVGDVMLLAAGDRRDVDVGAQRAILFREGHPLAVGRHRHRSNPSDVARRDGDRLTVGYAVVVKLAVGRGVEERLRIG